MFKPKLPALRTAAASLAMAGLLLAGVTAPAEAAGSHPLTVHVGSGNCPAGYSGVKSVQLAVVPSSSSVPYPVAGNSVTFTVPGTAGLFTIAGVANCSKAWWAWWWLPSVTQARITKWVTLSSTQRDVYV